jgi:hypothetical protein
MTKINNNIAFGTNWGDTSGRQPGCPVIPGARTGRFGKVGRLGNFVVGKGVKIAVLKRALRTRKRRLMATTEQILV